MLNVIEQSASLQEPFRKSKGRVQKVIFHPLKPLFFLAVRHFPKCEVYHVMGCSVVFSDTNMCSGVRPCPAGIGQEVTV